MPRVRRSCTDWFSWASISAPLQREKSPFGQSIFKEHWRLKWSPKIEASLIERKPPRRHIESAATTLLRESLGVSAIEAGPACRRLVQAVDMDLPQLVAQAEQNRPCDRSR